LLTFTIKAFFTLFIWCTNFTCAICAALVCKAELAKITEIAKHALAESILGKFRSKDTRAAPQQQQQQRHHQHTGSHPGTCPPLIPIKSPREAYFGSASFAEDLLTLCDRAIEILRGEDRYNNNIRRRVEKSCIIG
jgi:hypothetical protein